MIGNLIVDDQDLVREELRMLLEAEPDLAVAGEAGTGSQALDQARLLDPDVILMDIRMPRMNGMNGIHPARPGRVRARILMLTTFNLDEYIYHALKAGERLPAQRRQPRAPDRRRARCRPARASSPRPSPGG